MTGDRVRNSLPARRPFTAKTGVRIPLGAPLRYKTGNALADLVFGNDGLFELSLDHAWKLWPIASMAAKPASTEAARIVSLVGTLEKATEKSEHRLKIHRQPHPPPR